MASICFQLSLILLSTTIYGLSMTSLEAGSLIVEDNYLRLNTCIFKNVDLNLKKNQFLQNPSIKPLAAISNAKMNNQLTLQFFYEIVCTDLHCQLQFTIERITPSVSGFFSYQLKIDYVIASNLIFKEVNMTNSFQTFSLPSDVQNQQNDQTSNLQSQSDKQITAVLVPNGFRDITLTGKVELTKLSNQQTFVLKYLKSEDASSQQWIANQKFILYKIVFITKEARSDLQSVDLMTFDGLQSIKESTVSLEQSISAKYFHIPFEKTTQFIDNRLPNANYQLTLAQVQPSQTSSYLVRIFVGTILLVTFEMIYLLYRNKLREQNRQAGRQISQKMPELIISFNEPTDYPQKQLSQIPIPTQSSTPLELKDDDLN